MSVLADMLKAHPPYPPLRESLHLIVELELERFAELANRTLLDCCSGRSLNKVEAMNFTARFLEVAEKRSDEFYRFIG